MAIFDTKETEKHFALSAEEKPKIQEVIWSDRESTMREAIGTISAGTVKYFVSNGSWSMYELLKYVLQQTGPADIDAFTWNLSMPAVTVLIDLRQQGLIRKFRMLCHSAMARYTAEAVSVMQNNCDRLVLFANHAKGFLLKNEKWTVSVVSSANFSNNPQIEAGSISTDPEIYKMHKMWLNLLFENRELFSRERLEDRSMRPEEPVDDRPRLFLIRGLPGSGKTLLAKSIADKVFENNDFFVDLDGNYNFTKTNMVYAESETYNRVRTAMEDQVKKIAVSNAFIRSSELQPYIKLAESYGYVVQVMIVENRQQTQNIHNVSEERIASMRSRFEVQL